MVTGDCPDCGKNMWLDYDGVCYCKKGIKPMTTEPGRSGGECEPCNVEACPHWYAGMRFDCLYGLPPDSCNLHKAWNTHPTPPTEAVEKHPTDEDKKKLGGMLAYHGYYFPSGRERGIEKVRKLAIAFGVEADLDKMIAEYKRLNNTYDH